MKLKDLNTLPKVRDSISYLYVEHCKIEQDAKAIAFYDADGKTSVPCSSLTTLLIGPGSTITHSAVKTLADNGCLIMWSGEGAVRFYAQGMGESYSAKRLLRQAYLSSIPQLRLQVVRRMYQMRFEEELPEDMTLQQIRGREGVRVRTAYSQASAKYGVEWTGRRYDRSEWMAADAVNRALSVANSYLYGVCHAAIVSAGYSTALGFIHTGKIRSFVYDIADLYKADITIPLSFEMVAVSEFDLEKRIRHHLRDRFHQERFLSRIIPDIENVLAVSVNNDEIEFDLDDADPGGLWDGGDSSVSAGVNWSNDENEQRSKEIKELVESVSKKMHDNDANSPMNDTLPAAENVPLTEQLVKNESSPPASETEPETNGSSTKNNDKQKDATDLDRLPWDEGGQVF